MASRESVAALVAQRRKDAIDLRVAGADLLTIARQLAADPAINAKGVSYPHGYGAARYAKGQSAPSLGSLKSMVVNDITRALAERRSELNSSIDRLIDVATERLERLWSLAFVAASAGDVSAIDRALRVLERQARLLGLDAETRTKVHLRISDSEIDEEIELVLTKMAEMTNPSGVVTTQ